MKQIHSVCISCLIVYLRVYLSWLEDNYMPGTCIGYQRFPLQFQFICALDHGRMDHGHHDMDQFEFEEKHGLVEVYAHDAQRECGVSDIRYS